MLDNCSYSCPCQDPFNDPSVRALLCLFKLSGTADRLLVLVLREGKFEMCVKDPVLLLDNLGVAAPDSMEVSDDLRSTVDAALLDLLLDSRLGPSGSKS